MKWIRNVVVDLVTTIIILLMVVQGWDWAEVVVWIYTPLMLCLKAGALWAGPLMGLTRQGDVPVWLYHVIYVVNVAALVYGAQWNRLWWILAAMWAGIWVLSILASRRG